MKFSNKTYNTLKWVILTVAPALMTLVSAPVSYTHLTLPTICSV